jgi:hypothetical protein
MARWFPCWNARFDQGPAVAKSRSQQPRFEQVAGIEHQVTGITVDQEGHDFVFSAPDRRRARHGVAASPSLLPWLLQSLPSVGHLPLAFGGNSLQESAGSVAHLLLHRLIRIELGVARCIRLPVANIAVHFR